MAMAEGQGKRRWYCKSRTGCLQCKQRKIKCDEGKPSCHNCIRHRVSCSYLQSVPVLPGYTRMHQQAVSPRSSTGTSPAQPITSGKTSSRHRSPQPTRQNRRNTPNPHPADLHTHALPIHFSMAELKLFDFYTTTSSHSILGPHMTGSAIWSTSIIQTAFHFPFLIHGLLSLSALHLHHLHFTSSSPNYTSRESEYTTAATHHYIRCISSFRATIAEGITRQNAAACTAGAAVLSFLSWLSPEGKGSDIFFPSASPSPSSSSDSNASRDGCVPWYKLHRGGHALVSSASRWVEASSLREMVTPWKDLRTSTPASATRNPEEPTPNSDTTHLSSLAACWRTSTPLPVSGVAPALSEQDTAALDVTLDLLRSTFALVPSLSSVSSSTKPTAPPPVKAQVSAAIATLGFPSFLPEHFCGMVESRIPQALVLLGAYCVLLKRMEGSWWVKGKAESLLHAVQEALPERTWDSWMEWPVREMEGNMVGELDQSNAV